MKIIFSKALAWLCGWIFLFTALEVGAHHSPFILITLAKSGTHLMQKTLYYLTGCKPVWIAGVLSEEEVPFTYPFTHFCVSPDVEQKFHNVKKIVLIRDLRDVVLSMVHHFKQWPWPLLKDVRVDFFKYVIRRANLICHELCLRSSRNSIR